MSRKIVPEMDVPENTIDYTRANVSQREIPVIHHMKSNKVTDKSSAALVSRIKKVTRTQKINDMLCAAVAFTSIMVVYYEVRFTQSEEFYDKEVIVVGTELVTVKDRNESNVKVNVMRSVNILLTILILLFVHRHWMTELTLKRLKGELLSVCKDYIGGLRGSGMLKWYIIEMVVMAVFCPPYFDYQFSGTMLHGSYTYSYDSLIAIITVLRGFQIAKMYKYVSLWMSYEAYKLGKKFSVKPDLLFSLKADLKYRPHILLPIIIAATVLVFGFAVRNLERSFESPSKCSLNFDYLTNGWWMTVVTMTTVGYGDGYPSTHLGRVMMIFVAVLSLVVVSLYVVALTMATVFSKEEIKAYYIIKKVKANIGVKEKAANVIKAAFRLKACKTARRMTSRTAQTFIYAAQLKREIHYFAKDSSIANTRYLPPPEMLVQLEQKVFSDLDEIRKEIIDIHYIGERLQELMTNQEGISKTLDNILQAQNDLEAALMKLHARELAKKKAQESEIDLTHQLS